ncbi:unnamed protein product [Notodromas monacha]|uniref:Uncharacterized protein n=1 Tax=Notodromas monacha TaxID=399045 RepID=A0A7R9BSX2_9CRUS|nr:unnamed protein product [Notodromas monacha]CAG0920083.1 unnamed protein product [Notodromas monacha]
MWCLQDDDLGAESVGTKVDTWMQGRVGGADAAILDSPSQCTHRTHTCHHAAHAYTGVPCAAYITRPNHHHAIKGPARPFLPKIDRGGALMEPAVDLKNFDPGRPLTLELNHGGQRQVIEFPANKLDKSRKYHVTFTIKPSTPLELDGNPPAPAPLRRPMPAGISVQELRKQLSGL